MEDRLTQSFPAPKLRHRVSRLTLVVDCILVLLVMYMLLVPLSAKVIDRQRPPETPRMQLMPAARHTVQIYTT